MCVCVHISWGMKKSHGSIKEKEEERHFPSLSERMVWTLKTILSILFIRKKENKASVS